jgi:hypothetical protein
MERKCRLPGSGASGLLGCLMTAAILAGGCGVEGDREQDVEQVTDNLYRLGPLWTGGVVNVCYFNSIGNSPLFEEARVILANTWQRAARVSFVGWNECPPFGGGNPPLTQVTLIPDTNGSSNLGMPGPGGLNRLFLISNDPAPRRHFAYEVIHEFGHALGWAHEQERPDNWDSGGNALYCNSLDQGRKSRPGGVYDTPYFDRASIMDYCSPDNWPNMLSNGDIAGIRKAYGSHPLFTPGDFNGDGKTDFIITTSAGSSWYYSTGVNWFGFATWNVALTRTDLKLDTVSFTPGDFNGDGTTDVVISNSSGSYWYYFNTTPGSFTEGYRRTDLPRDRNEYTPGDFNGDGKTDLIITNPSGSYWYYSTGTGTWSGSFTRDDLPIGSVKFTPGDFNGDGKTDVIIASKTGSSWYYSTGIGWNGNLYNRTDLPLSSVAYVTGDFDGDGNTDVIISNSSGSYWYYGLAAGGFTEGYTRTDLPVAKVSYAPADYDGDGLTDVIITTATGSYWYYSTGRGTWNASAYNRTDLPIGMAQYTPGDFSGDGKEDVIVTKPGESAWYLSRGTGSWNTSSYFRLDLGL